MMRLMLGLFKQQARFEELPELALKKAEDHWHRWQLIEKTLAIKKKCYSEKMQPLISIMVLLTCSKIQKILKVNSTFYSPTKPGQAPIYSINLSLSPSLIK